MEQMKKAKEQFLKRYPQGDKRLCYFSDNFEQWISSLPTEIAPTVISMLEKFDYYTQSEVNQMLVSLHDKITRKYGVENKEALHTYIKKSKGRICSSMDYLYEYRMLNGINKGFCSDDIKDIPNEDWQRIQNIVIIDDCCGTGGSLENYIENVKKNFKGKKLFYLVIHVMDEAKSKLKDIEHKYEVEIHLLHINLRKKAYEIIECEDALQKKEELKRASSQLGIHEDYHFGKDTSEALMAFYNNTPNNTVGLFWFAGKDYSPIFSRDFGEKPAWQEMKTKRRKRKISNYSAVKKHG